MALRRVRPIFATEKWIGERNSVKQWREEEVRGKCFAYIGTRSGSGTRE